MKSIILQAETRKSGKAQDLIKSSRVPAVVYGKEMKENELISLEYQEFKKAYSKAGMSTIIDLKIGDKEIPVLVQSIDIDPAKDTYIHIDFKAVVMGQELTAQVPLRFTGECDAVKLLHGILVYNKESIDVKCLPRNLISEIEVDLSSLVDFNSAITVADLNIPDTINVLIDPETVVVGVTAPRVEKEPEEITEEGKEGAEGEEAKEGEGEAKEGEGEKKEG